MTNPIKLFLGISQNAEANALSQLLYGNPEAESVAWQLRFRLSTFHLNSFTQTTKLPLSNAAKVFPVVKPGEILIESNKLDHKLKYLQYLQPV